MPSLRSASLLVDARSQAPEVAACLPKAYDFPRCREALRKRGITARIARRGIESSEKLGRYRWVVERTLSWLNRYRRLKVRYERRDDIYQAFLSYRVHVAPQRRTSG
jgi:transposase